MSNIQAQIDALAASIQVLDNTVSNVTGNTLSNYNQLSRIVAQQSNIYNTVYFGSGNLSTGNLFTTSNGNINGNLIVNLGNLGIGTALPLAKLDVLGNARISGNLNVDNGAFWIDATNNRVGILNTNPLQALDVVGSANLTGSLFVSNQLNAAYGTNAETELAINYAGYLGGATQFRNTTFFDGKNTAIAKLLGSTGNLGIGTLTPTQKLDIVGSANVTGGYYINDASFDCYITKNQINASFNGTGDDAELAINYAGYQGGATKFRDTTFYNGKNGAISKLLGSTGNFGIGTVSPFQKLDVRGNVYILGQGPTTNGLNINAGFKQNTATNGYVTYDISGTGTHYFGDNLETTGTISAGSPIIPLYNPSALTSNTYIGFHASSLNNTLPSGNSITTIFTISLPAGVWLLEGESDYQGSTSSLRVVGFNTATTPFDTSRSQNLTGTGGIALRVTTVYSLTATTTIYFLVQNGAGTSSSAINNLKYTRIA